MAKTLSDSVLGNIKWNDRYNWWEGESALNSGDRFSFSISVDSEDEAIPPPIIERFNFLKQNENQIHQNIAAQMLELFNDTWSEGEQITEQDFIKTTKLADASFSDDGDVELFYEDGDLFAGHSIVTTLDKSGKISDPYLAG